jgi:hypothetical protein
MVDVAILKTADHLHNGIHLANMTEKLVSQSLALARPFDQTRNIDKFDSRRDDFLGFRQLGQHVEPFIRHGHDTLIRLDGAKWIISRLRLAGAGHGIEEGGLSDIGQTDDSGLEHKTSTLRRPAGDQSSKFRLWHFLIWRAATELEGPAGRPGSFLAAIDF